MRVLEMSTGMEKEAVVERLGRREFGHVRAGGRFTFNWGLYKFGEVYKLRIKEEKDILGLLCIVDHSRETKDAVEIVCLELSKGNVGRGKKIDWIAGCLIAGRYYDRRA